MGGWGDRAPMADAMGCHGRPLGPRLPAPQGVEPRALKPRPRNRSGAPGPARSCGAGPLDAAPARCRLEQKHRSQRRAGRGKARSTPAAPPAGTGLPPTGSQNLGSRPARPPAPPQGAAESHPAPAPAGSRPPRQTSRRCPPGRPC